MLSPPEWGWDWELAFGFFFLLDFGGLSGIRSRQSRPYADGIERLAMSYTKIFNSLVRSSVWSGTPKSVKIMWITVLSLADKNGEVRGNVRGLAKDAELTQDEADEALRYLMSPDPYSTTPDYEGRRLLPLPDGGGWWVVTHEKYRNLLTREDMQAKDAERQRRRRAAKANERDTDA